MIQLWKQNWDQAKHFHMLEKERTHFFFWFEQHFLPNPAIRRRLKPRSCLSKIEWNRNSRVAIWKKEVISNRPPSLQFHKKSLLPFFRKKNVYKNGILLIMNRISDSAKCIFGHFYFLMLKTPYADFDLWYHKINISSEKFTSLPNLTFYYDHDIHCPGC